MKEKIIGIIGGMGPEATVDVFSKIVAATPSRKDQDHLRVIIDNNPKVPSRFKFIMGDGEDPLPVLIGMAEQLERYGADLLLIPCNAAHHFYDEIQQKVGIPVLHIAEETRHYLESMDPMPGRVGLMASGSTAKSGVYQKAFQGSGIQLILPESKDQQIISEAIYSFKQGVRGRKIKRELMEVAQSLANAGAHVIILGCTELPLILGKSRGSPIIFVDGNQVLAQAAVRMARTVRAW
jgi:aspartate racemase